jgi:hypothetical protein
MNRTECALVLSVLLVGCRADEPSDQVLGAERASPAAETANPSAPESTPATTAPVGPGQDHGTPEGPPADPNVNVCAGEDPPAPGSAVCDPEDEPQSESDDRNRSGQSSG